VITVGELMSTDLLTVEDSASLADARRLMTEEHIRHLPVVNGLQEFVGLLTQRDVLASSLSALAEVDREEREALESSIPVRELMHSDLAVVEEDTSLREAAVYLLQHKIGCLPVVSSGSLVGIITESDFLKLVIKLLDRFET
jgi:CBS domain-containing membrane protein